MKLRFWRKTPQKKEKKILGPTDLQRFYYPRGTEGRPGYKVAPMTDGQVFRLVERHGIYYPVFRGFFSALLRLVYGIERTTEPYNDRVLGDYPVREFDSGEGGYDWESIVPWPYRAIRRQPEWHPWLRGLPATQERVTTEKGEDGKVVEKKEMVEKKGKLRFFVLVKGLTEVPALSLGTYCQMIDYAHGYGGVGEMAALRDVALERAVRAEGAIFIEGSRMAMALYAERFRAMTLEGSERSSVTRDILDQLKDLKDKAAQEDQDG